MRIRFYFFCALVFGSLFYSCRLQNKQNVEGGDCSYDTTLLSATVIDTYEANPGQFEARFIVGGARKEMTMKDTLYYSQEFSSYFTQRDADSLHIKGGERFRYVIKSLREGSCTDHIEQLQLVPY